MSTIITRNSATSGSTPSSLVQGELAINVTDGRLFYGSGSGNTVKEFTVSGSGGATNTGSLLTTASFSNPNLTFTKGNGSTFNVNLTSLVPTSASYATTSSFITSSGVYGPYGSNSILTASYAETSSYSQNSSDIIVKVLNQSGNNIAKGVVVRITGSNNSSDIPRIVTASYENDNNSANTLGITREAIINGNEGYVITEGVLTGINTTSFISGQLIYLGATGSIIGTAPVAPLHAVRLGEVIRQQSNNGSIYVRIDNGYELGELHDVRDTTTTSSFGNLLVKSGSIWISGRQLTGSYGLTGSLTAISFTGSLFGTASYATQALSASWAPGGGPTFPYTGSAIISGSLEITGSFSVNNGTATKIDTSISQLLDDTSINSVDWQNRFLLDSVGNGSMEWNNRTLLDFSANYIIEYGGINGLNITNYRPTVEILNLEAQEDFTQNAIGFGPMTTNTAGNIVTVNLNIDAAVSASELTFLDTDGIWKRANQTTDTSTKLLGICIQPYFRGNILTEGIITVTTSSGYTDIPLVSGTSFYGMPVYFTGSAATFTTDKPTSGYVRVAGHMYYNSTTNPDYWIMKFNPSNDWYQI